MDVYNFKPHESANVIAPKITLVNSSKWFQLEKGLLKVFFSVNNVTYFIEYCGLRI